MKTHFYVEVACLLTLKVIDIGVSNATRSNFQASLLTKLFKRASKSIINAKDSGNL